ncbi:hypothetical protein Tco_0787427 [Tanacetum coccineum]
MDDEPMWAADRVVAPTPGSAITIPETANEFAIKVFAEEGCRPYYGADITLCDHVMFCLVLDSQGLNLIAINIGEWSWLILSVDQFKRNLIGRKNNAMADLVNTSKVARFIPVFKFCVVDWLVVKHLLTFEVIPYLAGPSYGGIG